MGGGGPSTPDRTTTVSEPPEYVKPYSEELLNRGADLSNAPYNPYGGQKIAELTPEHYAGLDFKTQRAINGSPVMNSAQSNIQGTLNGDYMSPDSNPWLKQNVNQALNDVQGRVNTQFNKPGAWGGTAHQELLTRNLGDTASQLYGANYSNERTNQLRAAAFAPQLAAADYNDAEQLLSVGDAYRGYEQDLLNQSYQDWLDQQQYPNRQLDILGSAISTGSGGYQSTTSAATPYQSSPLAGALGGGLLGAGAAQAFGQNPWLGGAAGAGLGLWGS